MDTRVLGRRVTAFILDGLLVFAVSAGIFLAFAQEGAGAAGATIWLELTLGDTSYSATGARAALVLGLGLAVAIGYFVVVQGRTGATLGKALLGIRVVREDGTSPPGVGRAFGRWFLYLADGFPYAIPYLTGFVVALVNRRNQRIGDMVAGTLVVRRER